jgi:Na+/H+ antiporter NhaA
VCVARSVRRQRSRSKPDDLRRVGFLAGIGFDMRYFIETLAFSTAEHLTYVRVRILSGSSIASIAGPTEILLVSRKTDAGEI